MNTKKFSEAMSNVDNKYVEEALNYKKKNRRHLKAWGAIAACLCVACLGGYALLQSGNSITQPQNDPIANVVEEKQFVQMASILTNNIGKTATETAEESVKIPLVRYNGIYTKIPLKNTSVLKDSMGDEIEEATGWFGILGHADRQYLIENKDNEYCLWEFKCFDSNSYSYNEVLSTVYQIDSADKIIEVRVIPPTSNNTDAGKEIQAEIGTQTITDKDKIAKLYAIISSMTCYGENNWDKIDTGSADAAIDADNDSLNEIRLGRYLILVTDYGNEISGLKYTAVSNMFYEFSGIAYSTLKDEDAAEMRNILRIMNEVSTNLSDSENGEETDTSTNIDNTVNESENESTDSQNVTDNSANISLEYVTELQMQISDAMVRGELPFVSSSSVLEKPNRLHVVITSNSEDDRKKLESYDTVGGGIEIEYSPNSIGIKE